MPSARPRLTEKTGARGDRHGRPAPRLRLGREAAPGLAAQLAEPIDWAAMLEALVERGASRMLELGPGRALADMAFGAFPHLDIRALSDFHTIEAQRAWLRAR